MDYCFESPFFAPPGDPGEMFHVFEAHHGPHSTSDGEGLPSAVFHLRGLPPVSGWGPIYCGRHQPNTLH